jgi:hypothetical protein
MATNSPPDYQDSGHGSDGSIEQIEKSDARALTEALTVRPADGAGLYQVDSGSEGGPDSYQVDARDGACMCPDARHRDRRCKHIRRVAYATGGKEIPAWARREKIDSGLGEHVDGTPRLSTGEPLRAAGSADEAEQDTCALCASTDLGCFKHYNDD